MKKYFLFFVLLLLSQNIFGQNFRQHFFGASNATSLATLGIVVSQNGSPDIGWNSTSLSFPATNALAVSGGKVVIAGTTTGANSYANIPFSTTYSSGSVFVSFLFRGNIAPTGNSTDASSNFLFYLGNSYAGTNGTNGAAGSRTAMMHLRSNNGNIHLGTTKSGNENQTVSNGTYGVNASTFTTAGASLTSTRTFFVVMEYRFIAGNNNDEVRMWMYSDNQSYPSPFTVPTAGVILAGDNSLVQDIQSINQIGFTYGINQARNVNAEFDAVHVGTTWASVVPNIQTTANNVPTFGNVAIGTESATSQAINIRANALVDGSAITVTPPQHFMVSTNQFSNFSRNPITIGYDVATNQSAGQDIYVKFAPEANTTAGTKNGNVVINTPTNTFTPYNVSVSGNAIIPIPTIRVRTANGLDIPNNDQNVRIGQTANPNNTLTYTLEITNTGTSNLSVSNVVVSGAGFSLTSPTTFTQVPAPANATPITVSFPATTAGTFDGTITITSNTSVVADQTYVVYLRATIVTPTLTATPTSLMFAQTTGGQVSAPQTYTLMGANFANPININVTAPTNFEIGLGANPTTYSSSISVSSGSTMITGQVISVRFAPTLLIPTGNVTGTITHSSFANTTVALSASAVTELENWTNNFQILGNPTSEFVRVKCDNPAQWQNAQIRFTTLDGKPSFISKWENANNTLEINVSKWQKGIYILNIQQGKKLATQKIIIE